MIDEGLDGSLETANCMWLLKKTRHYMCSCLAEVPGNGGTTSRKRPYQLETNSNQGIFDCYVPIAGFNGINGLVTADVFSPHFGHSCNNVFLRRTRHEISLD